MKTSQQAGESSSKAAAAPTMPLCGSKMRKHFMGRLQESVSAPTSDFAKKQLEKMGWTDGTGLGRKRDGIVSHIKVQKRAENAGLGTERQSATERETAESWWKDSLGDTLARLASKNGKSKKRKKVFTDEELFEATGGARFGTKGSRGRQAKYRRTETESFDENTVEVPRDAEKNHDSMDSDKLFKEDDLNESHEEAPSEEVEKKRSTKDKKKKKSKKEGKKEKKRKKKSKRSEKQISRE